MQRSMDNSCKPVESRVMLLKLEKETKGWSQRKGYDAKNNNFVFLNSVSGPNFPMNIFAVVLGGTVGDDVVLDLLLEAGSIGIHLIATERGIIKYASNFSYCSRALK